MLLKWVGYDESTWEPEEVLEYPSLTQGFVEGRNRGNKRKWSKVAGVKEENMPSQPRGRPKKLKSDEKSTAANGSDPTLTVKLPQFKQFKCVFTFFGINLPGSKYERI